MIGQSIAHYQVLEKLGEGGMGVVYKARDTKLDRDVALKFLPSHVSATKEASARFLQEAKAAAALNHANICTIYGVEEQEGPDGSKRMFIVMEYIDGGTLRERLPLAGIAEAVSVAAQVGEALQEAHSKGIVHRDIKADNIMLTSKGQVKVMDFGLAKLKGSLKLTKTSSTVGTLGYMAPEQIGGGEVDARSDLFSFGVLIFEMLTGRLPFRGEHEAAMVYSIMNEQPEPLTKYLPDAPPELVILVSKALEKDPADRYQSVGEMLVDLRRLKKSTTRISRAYPLQPQGGAAATVSGAADAAGTAFRAAPSSSGAAPVEPKLVRSTKAIFFIVAAAVFVAIALLLFRTMRDDRVVPSAANMKMTRLTSSGDAGFATVSPDGKYVVYVKGQPGGQGLWIRQVASGTDINVIPPTDARIIGSSFSNDGNYVYYAAALPDAPVMTVYRTPVIGGAPPRKIIVNVDSPVSLSPDDTRLAFFRVYPATGEEALFIANTDGTGERKLTSRDGKNHFYTGAGTAPAWSPDGSVIACPAGTTVGKFRIDIIVVPVDDPREKPFTSAGWRDIGRIAWYPDGRGLIACASVEGEPMQIAYVSYPDGEVTRITNDLLEYGPSSLSITADASAIVTAQNQRNSTIQLAPAGAAPALREITTGATRVDGAGGLDWLDDRTVVYADFSAARGKLWKAGIDGSEPRQLTFTETSTVSDPSASPAVGFVYYVDTGDSVPCIWRVPAGGGNAERVTGGEDYNPEVSPDGQWLLFDSWRSGARSLWKQKIGPSDTATMYRHGAIDPKFSPDGRLVACWVHDEKEQRSRLTVLSFPEGATLNVVDLPGGGRPDFQWAPGGKTIHFEESRKGVSNIRSIDYRTGALADVTQFTSGRIFKFAWSPDGKNLAVARGQTTSDVVLLTISK